MNAMMVTMEDVSIIVSTQKVVTTVSVARTMSLHTMVHVMVRHYYCTTQKVVNTITVTPHYVLASNGRSLLLCQLFLLVEIEEEAHFSIPVYNKPHLSQTIVCTGMALHLETV